MASDLGGVRMTVRQLGGLLAVVGGLTWLLGLVVVPDIVGETALRWVGLAMVLLALACFGLTLVKGSALWLDLVVAFAAPALFWAVYEVVRAELGAAGSFHAILGGVVALVGLLPFRRRRAVDEDDEERAGQHA